MIKNQINIDKDKDEQIKYPSLIQDNHKESYSQYIVKQQKKQQNVIMLKNYIQDKFKNSIIAFYSNIYSAFLQIIDKKPIIRKKNSHIFLYSLFYSLSIVFVVMLLMFLNHIQSSYRKQNNLQQIQNIVFNDQQIIKQKTNQLIKLKKKHFKEIKQKQDYSKHSNGIQQIKKIFAQAVIQMKQKKIKDHILNKNKKIQIQAQCRQNIKINSSSLKNISYNQKINKNNLNKNKSYQNFLDKLETFSHLLKTKLHHMKLEPLIAKGYTTPIKRQNILKQFLNGVRSIYNGVNIGYQSLKQMLNNGGYWHSSGNLLSVSAVNEFSLDNNKNCQLIMPTLFQIIFPYDIPQNQTLKIWGISVDYTSIAIKSPSLRLLGKFSIDVKLEQRQKKLPIKRFFYCQQPDCANFYGYIKFETKYQFRVYELKIYSNQIIDIQ